MKQIRTIKYKGGKGLAFSALQPFFPEHYKRYFELFCGSATIGLTLKSIHPDLEVSLNDAWMPVCSILQRIRDDCPNFQHELRRTLNMLKKNHTDARKYYADHFSSLENLSPKQQAKHLWFIQRMAYTGNLVDGGFSPLCWQRTHSGLIDELSQVSTLLQGVEITNLCFSDAIESVLENDFVYCDPPYSKAWNQYRLGHFNINNLLKQPVGKMMISYDVIPPQAAQRGFEIDKVEIYHPTKHRRIDEVVLRNY